MSSVTKPRRCCADRGQVVPLLALVLLVTVGLIVTITRVASLVDDAARAQTAADAAALAGAAGGRGEAARYAEANGGELVDYVAFGSVVTVVVKVGEATAAARARGEIVWRPPDARD